MVLPLKIELRLVEIRVRNLRRISLHGFWRTTCELIETPVIAVASGVRGSNIDLQPVIRLYIPNFYALYCCLERTNLHFHRRISILLGACKRLRGGIQKTNGAGVYRIHEYSVRNHVQDKFVSTIYG